MSDARQFDRNSIFREVLANTEMLIRRQQSRRPLWAANGFAFVPHTRHFLGRQALGVEPAVKVTRLLHLPSQPPVEEDGQSRRRKHSARDLGLKSNLMTLCAQNMNLLFGMRFCAVFFGNACEICDAATKRVFLSCSSPMNQHFKNRPR
jgi:hypothetical protein